MALSWILNFKLSQSLSSCSFEGRLTAKDVHITHKIVGYSVSVMYDIVEYTINQIPLRPVFETVRVVFDFGELDGSVICVCDSM